ncbi:hypothetical protein QJ854_gp099 [Moumouvirus goulette]|uniref:Uncharacterized protein n=1 Tax=Moumouvirus goulette TaxID=1247379 RepID=M1PHW1_9VIRU|nr:hypothetical protein QJ854_gp099 [Moumouvirus goulette]AGF85683.1 hypothetical protein glt_00880 [Moumouvirus goulette]
MKIYRFEIDDAVNSITIEEFCNDDSHINCYEFHYKYLADKDLQDFEKELIERIYNYYIRCINFIKDNWCKEYHCKKMPDTNIMKIDDLFIDHLKNDEESIIIKTITIAHKLYDRTIRYSVEIYDFNGCECGTFYTSGDSRCACENRRVKLTHKGLDINWISSINLDSKKSVSIPIGY